MGFLIFLGAVLALWAMSSALSQRINAARGRSFLCLAVIALVAVNANSLVGKAGGGPTAQALTLAAAPIIVTIKSAVVLGLALVVCTCMLAADRSHSDHDLP